MAEWTIEEVAARFAEAVETARRLPPVRVQGYFNVWPAYARDTWEAYPDDEHIYRPLPPTPQAIERMMETMHWVLWLAERQRHLVWMRARRCEWQEIARRTGCHRATAWRHWRASLEIVAAQLMSDSGATSKRKLRQIAS